VVRLLDYPLFVTVQLKEPLINPSFRRMPESIALNSLDPGMRRDDAKRLNQKFLNRFEIVLRLLAE
jgi:hypothetical protein